MERLRILFFVSPKVDAVAVNHKLTTGLAHGLADSIDVDLRTSLHGINAAQLSKYNIVHIFGCWNAASIRLQQHAYRLCIPTVYTLLGGLQPWNIKKHKSSHAYQAQKKTIRKASSVHLCSKLEYDTLNKLGWNKRRVLINNPVLTSRITFTEMSNMMATLYRKVLDSNARLLLSSDARQAIGDLFQIGIDHDVLFDHKHCASVKELLERLTDTDWRRIMIYADDEAITVPIKKGLERMQFVPPEIVIEDIDRFATGSTYNSGALQDNELCFKSASLNSKLATFIKEREVNERKLCIELLNLKHEIEHHTAPLYHLGNVYSTMRFCNMDEDRLNEIVKDLDIDDFASRLITVMHNILNLTEGFMPFQPKDDRLAKQLENDITKFNRWT
jgi:hypothetical protein